MKRFVGKHALIIALTLFVCIALGIFAYLGSTGTPDGGQWDPNVTYSPSTPTVTLVPTDGWWTTISTTLTPKPSTP